MSTSAATAQPAQQSQSGLASSLTRSSGLSTDSTVTVTEPTSTSSPFVQLPPSVSAVLRQGGSGAGSVLLAGPPAGPAEWVLTARDLCAGTLGACAGIVVGQPLDTVRVRMQASSAPLGMIACIANTARHEGPAAFFKVRSNKHHRIITHT